MPMFNEHPIELGIAGHEAEIVLPELPVDSTGTLLKDFTGEIFELDAEWNA